jgi:carbonic anhydrase/acetyltransferase-like protein (isoleucine patch superfamily)
VQDEKMFEEDTTEYLVEIVLFEPPMAAWGIIMNKNVFIAPGAHVIGDVHLGENVGVWYNAVVRGDTSTITIGDNSNVQDNATIHTDSDYKVHVGKGVTIGHNAIVHGCTVGDNTVIGMGSIVLSGAVIGDNCIIGAGSLVTGKTRIPDNSLAFGNPAKVVRTVTETEIIANQENAAHYVQLMKEKK